MWAGLQQLPQGQSSPKRPEQIGLQLGEPSPSLATVPGVGAGPRALRSLEGRLGCWAGKRHCTHFQLEERGHCVLLCVCNRLHFCQGNTHSCQHLLTEQALTGLLGRDKSKQEESWHPSPPQWGAFMSTIILISSCFCQKQEKKNPRCLNQQSTSCVEANKALYCRLKPAFSPSG